MNILVCFIFVHPSRYVQSYLLVNCCRDCYYLFIFTSFFLYVLCNQWYGTSKEYNLVITLDTTLKLPLYELHAFFSTTETIKIHAGASNFLLFVHCQCWSRFGLFFSKMYLNFFQQKTKLVSQ